MAGHSKWANRKHRKARQDAKRGKVFSKMAREITIATRQGGGDPDANPRLRLAVDRAREYSVPQDNIERAIKKGLGNQEGVSYEEIRYEGYGPGGAALMLDLVTDNRNRTAQEIRFIFSRHGGNLGESGCVAWMFEQKGLILTEPGAAEDEVFLVAVESGAEDVENDGGTLSVITPPAAFADVLKALQQAGIPLGPAEVTYLPSSQIQLEGTEAQQLVRLVDALEDQDDVQNVYGNFEIADDSLLEVEP